LGRTATKNAASTRPILVAVWLTLDQCAGRP